MKKLFTVLAIFIFITAGLQALEGFKGRPITSNVWMPTGYTLHDGEFMIGIGPFAYGITEEIQLETNVLLDILTIFNAGIKANVINDENGALAVGANYLHFNLSTLVDIGANKFEFDIIAPYVSYSTKIDGDLQFHIGGNYSYLISDISIDSVDVPSYISGTSISAGLEYSLSNKTKFLGEAAYDLTLKGLRPGVAVLWGWESFRLKIGAGYAKYESTSAFIPVIDLWWRF